MRSRGHPVAWPHRGTAHRQGHAGDPRPPAAGRTVREISGQVHLAPSTVKSRLHSLYKALGVNAPTAAVAEAIRRRLID